MVGQDWLETITPPDIPSQPTAHEGLFHVEFIPNGGDDAFRLATTNIYYQFAPGYTAVRFNGERGADSLLNEVNYASPDDYFAALSPHLTDLEQPTTGRILLADGTWQDMQFGVPKGPEYEVVGGYRLGGPFGYGRPAFGPREDLDAYFYPPKAIDWHFVPTELTGSRKVCAAIEPDFRDGNRGETYGNSAIPASFMKASLFGSGLTILLPNGKVKRESIWTGWLDADGCTPELAIVKGKYSLVVTSSMHRVGADGFHSTYVDIQQKNAAGDMAPVSWALSFQTLVWVLEGTSPGLNVRITGGLAGNAAATASRLLRMDQEGIKPASYTIRLHDVPDGCVTQGQKVGALLNTNGIDICPNDGAPANENNAYYKFVIAHELGHYVERESHGTIPSPPDWTNPYAVSDSGANIPLGCNCSFVVPAGNRLHCLQSQEVYSMGSVEGFGQFFATRMWNDPAAAAPRFQYYKHFREPTGTVLPPGGKIVNVRQTPIKWSDTYCPATADGRSTEYDFLGFYWSINTAPSAERTPLDHLFAIMKLVEDNPSDARIWNGTLVENAGSWAIYDKAARDHYGPGDPRYDRFRLDGPKFGINH
ncbi:hypothetical protein AKJ09_10965 [Labilithrix luteola]|uniref:Uncharacterized protein n=1 Tax=Labilithrix luteola TaxID=1391654 RepID=A0A0K1QF79_9BACT|nr:hypothetical protein [Labilithrix luteola]AKV04302.1 hypothetical protein AKJ09_10965 [Labilithrix luteola]